MFTSGNHSFYFAPPTDALLKAINPMLSPYKATVVSGSNQDPTDFTAHYPNLFSVVDKADATWISPLSTVDALAQAYHAKTGIGSVNGISTLCLYTARETLSVASAEGPGGGWRMRT